MESLKKLPVTHAMHPLIILFISNPVSHSCNTIKASLLHLLITLALDFFSVSLHHSVSCLCAKAFKCSFIIQSTLLLHPQGLEGASLYYYFLLSSFSVAHHSFSVHEGVHDNIINTQHSGHTECNDPWVLTTCLIVILALISSCVTKQRHTSKDPEHQRRHPDCSWYPAEDYPYTRGGEGLVLVAYLDECHLNVELTLFFWCSISIIKEWTLIVSCVCWFIRV